MKKFLKTSLIIALSTMVLTSCSSRNNNVIKSTPITSTSESSTPLKDTPSNLPASPSAAATSAPKNATAGEVNKLPDLYSAERVLDIKKASDSAFYNTSKVLLYSIADLLSKANLLDNTNQQDAAISSKFDKKKYDYVLQFDGAKPIFVSTKDNLFFFEGENELYKFWADSKNLWNNLIFDKTKNTVDINDKGLEIQEKTFDSDINADGKKEKVSLIYNKDKELDFKGDLILRVDNNDATILSKTQWQVNPTRTIFQPPTIYFMPQKGSQNSIIIVTLAWLDQSIESLGDVFAYVYNNGKFSDLDLHAPQTVFNYTSGNTVKVDFPELNSSQLLRFDSPSYERRIEDGKTLKEFLNDPKSLMNTPLSFKIGDYDGDGIKELCSMSNLMFESKGEMSMGIEYTFYKSANNTLKPAKVIIAPPYISKDKDVLIERYIMNLVFYHDYLTVKNNEIKDSWYKPSNEFKKEEIAGGINRMITENKLFKKGNKVYVKMN